METDERLCEKLKGGDLAAFDVLYARYERRLYAFIHHYLNDSAEVEDVFHEAFLAVLKSGDVDFNQGSFKSWIYRIARNLCLNRLRSRKRGERARTEAALSNALSAPRGHTPTSPDEQLELREAGVALGRAVARLPVPLSDVYRLRRSGLSYEEMAEVLALPLGTVKSRMHEMVRQLKKEMATWTAS